SLGCPEEITSIHHVGIDCEQFSFQSRSRKNGESTIFISVARLVEKKGLEYAIKAFSRLRFSSQENFNFQYRIIGDGPLLESLQQLVTDENLGEYVLFLGSKTSEEVAFELGCAHIFLAPSVTASDGDMEGIPTVLMEAMATGLPVISTYHSGIPELVEDGVSGVLVKERDIPGLATAIEHLSTDIENWSRMGEAGREKVLCDFNIEKLNVRLDRLFRLLLEKYRQ
ncbi:MAG: glycosyltransferase, partial [Thiotrichaceae bacterium]